MRRSILTMSFLAALVPGGLAVAAPVPGDWTKAERLRGQFGVEIGAARSDPRSAAMVSTELSGFLLQGTSALKRVSAGPQSILFKGKARGILLLHHRVEGGGGDAVKGTELCAGGFENGEVLVEVFPRQREYQVQFSGDVPGCAATTSFPAFERFRLLLATAHAQFSTKAGPEWSAFTEKVRRARDEVAAAARTEHRTATMSFSASAVPEFRKDAGSRFPVMHFFPLPAGDEPILNGNGTVQLVLSTSVFPTTVNTRAVWSFEAEG